MSRRSFGTYALYLLPFALTACGNKVSSDPRTELPLVKTTTVLSAPAISQSFTGVVASRVQSDLGFRVAGKVLERLVDVGQTVKRGQPLLRIDPIDLSLEANARAEVVAAARAHAKQTADDEARYRDLVTAGAVSASAYDQIKAAADSAKAQLKAAEAQSGVAKNASSYAVLTADSDGVVVETLVEPGQVVNAGQVVVRLAHAGPREAVIQLPETLRPGIGSQATATLYGEDKVVGGAKLRQLSDAADRVTRTYEAKYVLDGTLASAPIGSTVTIKLLNKRIGKTTDVQVPSSAVYDAGKESGVWVLDQKSAQLNWRPVTIVSINDEAARVEGNLNAGDQIVALGAHLLHEGEKVRVQGAATQAPKAAPAGDTK